MLINQNVTGMLHGARSGYGPPLPCAPEILKPGNTFSEAVLCHPPPPHPPLDGFCRQKPGARRPFSWSCSTIRGSAGPFRAPVGDSDSKGAFKDHINESSEESSCKAFELITAWSCYELPVC